MFESKVGRRGMQACAGLLLALAMPLASANTVEISAEYRPSEGTGQFRDTTPTSGYCAVAACPGGPHTVEVPVTYSRTVQTGLPPIPQRWSLQGPPSKTVTVTSDKGDSAELKIEITHLAQRLSGRGLGFEAYENPGAHYAAGGGCTYLRGMVYESTAIAMFMWQVNNPSQPTLCYPTTSHQVSSREITPLMESLSVGYRLIMPQPFKMAMGIYRGAATYTVGEVGDFSLGSGVTGLSASHVTFNFTLTVNHELSIQFGANSDRVVLEPPSGSWQRWLATGEPPEKLEAKLRFRLTTSGPFKLTMSCGERGDHVVLGACIIRNKRTHEPNYFNTLIYPPINSGRWPFIIGPEQTVVFNPYGPVNAAPGEILFLIHAPHVWDMFKTPGDDWSGLVTLIFDATI